MNNREILLQLNHLNKAAHLLAKTVPETSAYLMRSRNGLIVANDRSLSDAHRERVCGACGHIMIPGQGSSLRIGGIDKLLRQKRHKDKKELQPRSTEKKISSHHRPRGRVERTTGTSKVYTCGNCGQQTKISLPPPRAITRQKAAKGLSGDTAIGSGGGSILSTAAPKPSANAGSKKRKKNRKEGLQALLSQSQSQPSAGSGLSLADFLKK